MKPLRILEAHVVGTPSLQRLSLTATGIPARSPSGSPRHDACQFVQRQQVLVVRRHAQTLGLRIHAS